jgi:CarD family transcriptional regulator
MKSSAGNEATARKAAREPAPAKSVEKGAERFHSKTKAQTPAGGRAKAASMPTPERRSGPEAAGASSTPPEEQASTARETPPSRKPPAKTAVSTPAKKSASASARETSAEPEARAATEQRDENSKPDKASAGRSAPPSSAAAKQEEEPDAAVGAEAAEDDVLEPAEDSLPGEEAEESEEPDVPAAATAVPSLPPHLHRPPPRPLGPPETFAEGDHVVYPTHGVGKVERIAVEEIAGHKLELIHITFEENRMTLRVPVAKARSAGLRKLASRDLFDKAMDVLRGRARVKRTMWSRRAQEYEAKINSGDPLAIAEVVRDLHRNAGQPDQSFSERQIYEQAMDRLAAELAALERIDKATAAGKLSDFLKTV